MKITFREFPGRANFMECVSVGVIFGQNTMLSGNSYRLQVLLLCSKYFVLDWVLLPDIFQELFSGIASITRTTRGEYFLLGRFSFEGRDDRKWTGVFHNRKQNIQRIYQDLIVPHLSSDERRVSDDHIKRTPYRLGDIFRLGEVV